MASLDDFERLKLRLSVANALQLADDLLTAAILAEPNRVGGQLLKNELVLVIRHAREFAGLNVDGSFDPVPPAPAPAPKKARAK